MNTVIYYVRVGKYKEYLHIEIEGRKDDELREALAKALLPDEIEGAKRTAKIRCYALPNIEESPTTVRLGYELSSQHFKLNETNIGGFR